MQCALTPPKPMLDTETTTSEVRGNLVSAILKDAFELTKGLSFSKDLTGGTTPFSRDLHILITETNPPAAYIGKPTSANLTPAGNFLDVLRNSPDFLCLNPL